MRSPLVSVSVPRTLAVILALSWAPTLAQASWVPIPVGQGPGLQYTPRAVPDGNGGSLVVFVSAGSVRVQHVLSSDSVDPSWPAGGRQVATAVDVSTAIASDGAGGAFVAWLQGADSDVYAHHVLASGTLDPGWPSLGVPVCTAPNNQVSVSIVSDGAGGALLAWADLRNSQSDVFAHHVLATGVVDPAWPANGLAVVSNALDQSLPVATSDGSGGILIAWQDNFDIRAQRVLSTGTIAAGWPVGGRSLVSNNDEQTHPRICTDGAGGAIVAWRDLRQGDFDVFAMRVEAGGSLSQGWRNGGEILCDAAQGQLLSDIIADGSGGAVVAWRDFRTPAISSDIYVQRVNSAGSVLWTADGVPICSTAGSSYAPSLGFDGTGAFLVSWNDDRMSVPGTLHIDLYMHRVLATGSPDGAWPVNGMRLTFDGKVRFSETDLQPVVSHGGGNATVFWAGNSGGNQDDVLAMNVTSSAYTVTVGVSPAEGGTATKSPNQVAHVPGSQVTLTASATRGYQFAGWSGDASGSTNPLDLTVDGPKNVVANFELEPPACGKWSKILSAVEPSGRSLAPTAWDPVRHRVLLFGGYDGTNYLNDVWQFTIDQGWSQVTTFATPPSPRWDAGLIYDPVRDRLLVVGGNTVAGTFLPPPPIDVWALSLTGNPTWSQITPAGTPPAGRLRFTTIYDPIRDRVLMFGGHLGGTSSNQTNTVWELSLSGSPAWTQLWPTGTLPSARYAHVAVYDPVRDRMIIHGGSIAIFPEDILSDSWGLMLNPSPAWAQIATFGGEPGEIPIPQFTDAGAAFDPIRDRMVLIGGRGRVFSGADTGRVSSLSFEIQPMWTTVLRHGWPFEPRKEHSVLYEPDHDLILVFGGSINFSGVPVIQGRRLDCGGGFWMQTGGSNGFVTSYPKKNCYDSGEVVALQATSQFSGYGFEQWLGDASGSNPLIDVTMDDNKVTIAQFQPGSVGVEDAPVSFALEEITPNPSAGSVRIAYSLPHAARVSVGVFDVSGRLMSRLVDGVREPGRYLATWDGLSNGARPSSGIYFVRLETSSGAWTRRVVLLR